MESNFIKAEFENIDRYFNGETLIENQKAESVVKMESNLCSRFLDAYIKNNNEELGQCIGKIALTNWSEEEKLLWNILLASRCQGSEQFIYDLELELSKFRHHNPLIETLLTDAGKILLSREVRARKEKYETCLEKLQASVDEKEKKMDEAKTNLKIHQASGNRA